MKNNSENKNRIFVILYGLSIGGAERRISIISNYLSNHGMDVNLVFIGDNPEIKYPLDDKINIIYLQRDVVTKSNNSISKKIYQKLLTFYCKIASIFSKPYADMLLKKNDMNIMYSDKIHKLVKKYPGCTVLSFMPYPNISTAIAIHNLPVRRIISEANDPYTQFEKNCGYYKLREKYFKYIHKAAFQTEYEKSFYSFLKNTDMYVIPNPLLGDFPERFTGQRNNVIVNFCRLSVEKNLPLLFDAFEIVHQKYTDYKLMIYGDGYLKAELLKKINEDGMTDSIIIKDFDINIHKKISDCAMFVSSSDREGMSNSMIEALAIGLPSVCTDCGGGGAKAIINPGENGLLVPIKDKQALADAMIYIIEHPKKAEYMSKNAVKIKDTLNPEKICNNWLNVVQGDI